MSAEVAQEEYQSALSGAYDLGSEVSALSKTYKNETKSAGGEFYISQLAVQRELYHSALLLLEKKHFMAAAIIARSMFEVLATINHVLEDVSKVEKRAAAYKNADKTFREMGYENLFKLFEDGEYPKYVKNSWSESTIEDRISKLHPKAAYIYAFLCDFTHINPWMPRWLVINPLLPSVYMLQMLQLNLRLSVTLAHPFEWFDEVKTNQILESFND